MAQANTVPGEDGHSPILRDERPKGPLISFDNVSYRYSGADRPALDTVSLTIGRGEIVGVIGPTGAGKTTFCLALNGIVPQFFGGEFYGGVHIAGLDAIETPTSRLAEIVGMVFEDPETQITATTVEGEVAFALENLKVPTPEIARRVGEALKAVGLAGQETRHPANLSGGQKQRLSIAAALALSSDIIVLDEPTSQLDPVASAEVFAILLKLNRENGLTVVIASHASEELAEIADRVLLISDGKVAAEGRPETVFAATKMLAEHRVRPPDIVRSFEVLVGDGSSAPGRRKPPVLPVTLGAAEAAIKAHPPAVSLSAGAPMDTRRDISKAGVALAVEGLTHIYPDGTQALRGVDLTVANGEFLGIVGRNGSGKSTLVRHFLNLLSPSAGTARVAGDDISTLKVSELAQRIGYVSQNAHAQVFCDTVAKEVGFALSMMKRPKADIDAAVSRSLAAMDLARAADQHPMSLSRGDRLRVVIAAVLALEPEILIFDEPTTGQDWRGSLAILDMLRTLNRMGKTVVLITHHLYLLPGYVDRLVVMDGGRIVGNGALRDVFYDNSAMEAAGLVPPQTVRFAGHVPALGVARPLGPDDLAAMLGPRLEVA
ncbi:ABC transporter related [Mesorhizobium metallidurans STM 2683]|uniref:ABC transporter related n=1 Tax=Mesorhizobium metallidurans STM 2683 TaxID=1297569 RepID=M5ET79_9HYPH|nr:energy-coupling factor transporter ATPase [Mesorhizobium metallidurans]CCV08174.1 ABC transporter related [Mesorhizobium metallidurans STM 2683]